MRILMSAVSPGGGIKTFLAYVYAQRFFADCDITLLAPSEKLKDYLVSRLPEGRAQIIVTPKGQRAMYGALRRALRRDTFDLIHSHGFTAGAITAMACVGRRAPHIMTAHDVFLPDTFRGGKRKRLMHLALAMAYRRLDAIHAVTRDGAANMREYFPGITPERIRTIEHGIDTRRFADAEPADARGELNMPRDAILVGFFGRFMAQKGFGTLVGAVEHLTNQGWTSADLRVITFGWGGFIREDYADLEARGLGAYFSQQVGTDEPERWMKAMDVIAMPSRWEACGLLAMEALAAGVPIVGTNCIGLREVLEGSPARQIEIGDSQELAAALVRSARPEARARFAEYQPTAVERFAVERPAQAIRALYGEFTGEVAPATTAAEDS